MKNLLSHGTVLVKRWIWMVILGVVLCGGAGYVTSKITHPVYQASATLILNVGTSTSPNESFTTSVQAVPAYAQLLTSNEVLGPVAGQHPGLTIEQLKAMVTVKPQTNTPLIELDVQNSNPGLARDLANEVALSFAQFANSQLSGTTLQILPAGLPTQPVSPKALTNAGIGALVGLALAIALIVIFEWLDDRPVSSEEVERLLDTEVLAIIPHVSRRQLKRKVEEIPLLAESYRMLVASLNSAQAEKPFKMLMVTSTLADEGKSTSAVNLAIFLASGGKRVLLVEADLRHPTLDQYFQLPEFADILAQTWTRAEGELYGQPTGVASLRVLTARTLSPGSTGLHQPLWSDQFFERLKQAPFDYIIFDTPPFLPIADSQVLASYIQAVVLVVDPSKTPRKLLLRVKQLLNRAHNRVIGVVINKSRWPEHGEIRQYLKEARHYHTVAPAMIRPPDTPPVKGQEDSLDITVVIPRQKARQGDQA